MGADAGDIVANAEVVVVLLSVGSLCLEDANAAL
jgi:hypothetical protein